MDPELSSATVDPNSVEIVIPGGDEPTPADSPMPTFGAPQGEAGAPADGAKPQEEKKEDLTDLFKK